MHLQDTPPHSASPAPWITRGEHRQAARAVLQRLAYIAIEPDNGGIVLNVSEAGLCFHSIAPVPSGQPVRFSITEHNVRMEAEAEVVWTDAAGTTGGLRFTRLPDAVRKEIRVWAKPQEGMEDTTAEHLPLPQQAARTIGRPSDRWVNRGIRVRVRLSGFARGLMTGFGLATLLAAGLLLHAYQRELGESLIRFGQRLAASPRIQPPTRPVETAASVPQPSPTTPVKATPISSTSPVRGSIKDHEDHDDRLTILPKRVAPALSDTTPVPGRVARSIASPVHSDLTPQAPLAADLPALAMSRNLVLDNPTLPRLSAPTRLREESNTAEGGPPPKLFFEVGKFKKEMVAEQARDKLAGLGLPASLVQQGHLWMISFHLLVGPYGDEAEAHAASRTLVSHGYTPRPFERGSRDFVFASRVTVNDTTMATGDCVVKWESYVPKAIVKFVQNEDLVATASGIWQQRSARFERNAIVYQRYPDGRRVLLEIQFAGMNRALVFTGS